VKSGTTTLVNNSFSTLASAQTYFTDHVLGLGSFAAGSTSIVIDFSLSASSLRGADMSYLLSALGSGALSTTRAPGQAGSAANTGSAGSAAGGQPPVVAGLQPSMGGSTIGTRLLRDEATLAAGRARRASR